MKIRTSIAALILTTTLVLGGCAHNIIDVPFPGGASSGSYSWNTKTVSALDYTVEANGAKTKLSLQFRSHDSSGAFKIIEQFGSATIDSLLFLNNNAQTLTGLTPRSVIAIPEPYSLLHKEIHTIERFPPMTHIVSLGDNFVACDDSSNLYYFTTSSNIWQLGTSQLKNKGETILAISAFKFSSTGTVNVVVATSGGTMLMSSDNGKSWSTGNIQQFTNPVTALATNGDGSLFAAVETKGVYQILPGSSKLIAPLSVIGSYPSALAIFIINSNAIASTNIALGTRGYGLWHYDLQAKNWTPYDNGIPKEDTIRFLVSNHSSSLLVAASKSLFHINSDSRLPYFDSAILISSGIFAAGYYDDFGHRFLITESRSSIYSIASDTYLPTTLDPLVDHKLNSITATATAIGIATDSGIYTFNNTNPLWINSSLGIATIKIKTVLSIPSSLVLLDSGSHGAIIGATWNAGTIESNGNMFAITATVIEHFDSIVLTNNVTFSDLYSVHYALSNSAGIDPLTLPDWVIYFAKDQGPVLIDQHQNQALLRRTYRSSK